MNEHPGQPEPRQDVLDEMRECAARGATGRDLIRLVQARLGVGKEVYLPVLWYLIRAFFLTLPAVLPLREWIPEDEDDKIDNLILPAIEATRSRWAKESSTSSRLSV